MTVRQLLTELTRPNVEPDMDVVVAATLFEGDAQTRVEHLHVWYALVDFVPMPDLAPGKFVHNECIVLEAAAKEIL